MMKTILPLLFAVTSLSAVACAAPTADSSSSSPAAEDNTPANEMMSAKEAVAKIPSTSMIGEKGPTEVVMPGDTKELPALQLYIPQLKVTYPVAGFNFTISNPSTIGSASGGAGGGKAKFSSLSVHVTPAIGTPSLALQLAKGMMFDKVVLFRAAQGKDKQVDVATFGTVAVVSMASQAQNQGVDETYEFAFGALDLKTPKNDTAKMDVTKNTSDITASGCSYGPFVQADPSWPVAAPATAIDRFTLLMSIDTTIGSATTGAGNGKASLDSLSIDSTFDKTGICALYDLHRGTNIGSLKFAVATHSDQKGNLVTPYKWESCVTFATGITISGGGTDPIQQHIDFAAGGIIRTDSTIDPKTGAAIDSAPSGWSFVNNKAISSCSAVTLGL